MIKFLERKCFLNIIFILIIVKIKRIKLRMYYVNYKKKQKKDFLQ